MNWNVDNRPNDAADRANVATVFNHISPGPGSGSSRPFDILTLAETDSASVSEIAAIAQLTFGSPFAFAVTAPDGGGDRTGFVFNTARVALIESVDLDTSLVHNTLRGRFRMLGAGPSGDVYLYAVHLRSGATSAIRAARVDEARVLRSDADGLGNVPVIFAGDFNWLGSDEVGANPIVSAYDVFTGPGAGQAFDPVNAPGNWRDNSAFIGLHTNDPGGPMDDRFDMQMVSAELLDGLGLDYVAGSYRVLGNNATHMLEGSITSGTGAPSSVLTALASLSDHLPVIVDYAIVPEPTLLVGAGALAMLILGRPRRVMV